MQAVREQGGLYEVQEAYFQDVCNGFTRFQDNDVLFAKITPCMENGKGALVKKLPAGIGTGSTEFFVLRSRPESDAGYVYHLMQWERTRIKAEAFMSGSAGQQRVLPVFFQRYKVFAPRRKIQARIAHILQTIDRAIEKTEALIDKYQQIKTGLMHDLFTRGIGPDGQLRPPREQAPELYQESPIGWIPKEWEVKKLGECAEVFNGTTPSRQIEQYWDGEIPWLSSGKVNEYIVENPSEWVTALALQTTPLRMVPKGAVIVGMIGQGKTRGMSARLNISATINQNIGAIVPDEENSGVFIHNLLTYDYSRLRGDGRGSNQSALNCDLIRAYDIARPRYEEQNNIAEVLLGHESHVQLEQQLLAKLKKQKSGLIHDLLTGKVKVNVNEDTYA